MDRPRRGRVPTEARRRTKPSTFHISQAEGTGPNPIGFVSAGGLAGVSAGQVITFRVEGDDFDNPAFDLEYSFIAGASVITAEYGGFVMRERIAETRTITLRRTVGDFSSSATVTLAPQSGPDLADEVTHYTLANRVHVCSKRNGERGHGNDREQHR